MTEKVYHEGFGWRYADEIARLEGIDRSTYLSLVKDDVDLQNYYTQERPSPDRSPIKGAVEEARGVNTRLPDIVFREKVGGWIKRSPVPLLTYGLFARTTQDPILKNHITQFSSQTMRDIQLFLSGKNLNEEETCRLDHLLVRQADFDDDGFSLFIETLAEWNYDTLCSIVRTHNFTLSSIAISQNFRNMKKGRVDTTLTEFRIEKTLRIFERRFELRFQKQFRARLTKACLDEHVRFALAFFPYLPLDLLASMREFWPETLVPFFQTLLYYDPRNFPKKHRTCMFEALATKGCSEIHRPERVSTAAEAFDTLDASKLFSIIDFLQKHPEIEVDKEELCASYDWAKTYTFTQPTYPNAQIGLFLRYRSACHLFSILFPPSEPFEKEADFIKAYKHIALLLEKTDADHVQSRLLTIKENHLDQKLEIVLRPGFTQMTPTDEGRSLEDFFTIGTPTNHISLINNATKDKALARTLFKIATHLSERVFTSLEKYCTLLQLALPNEHEWKEERLLISALNNLSKAPELPKDLFTRLSRVTDPLKVIATRIFTEKTVAESEEVLSRLGLEKRVHEEVVFKIRAEDLRRVGNLLLSIEEYAQIEFSQSELTRYLTTEFGSYTLEPLKQARATLLTHIDDDFLPQPIFEIIEEEIHSLPPEVPELKQLLLQATYARRPLPGLSHLRTYISPNTKRALLEGAEELIDDRPLNTPHSDCGHWNTIASWEEGPTLHLKKFNGNKTCKITVSLNLPQAWLEKDTALLDVYEALFPIFANERLFTKEKPPTSFEEMLESTTIFNLKEIWDAYIPMSSIDKKRVQLALWEFFTRARKAARLLATKLDIPLV